MDMNLDQRMLFCMEVFEILFNPDIINIAVHDAESARVFEAMVKSHHLDPKWQPWLTDENFRCFKNSTTGLYSIQGLDATLDLTVGQLTTRNNLFLHLRFITQNPDKVDGNGNLKQYAALARAGHKIMWIIKTDKNEFVGRIQDGEFIQNQPRAYNTVNPQTIQDDHGATYEQQNGDWNRQLSEVPEMSFSEIPQHVIDELS